MFLLFLIYGRTDTDLLAVSWFCSTQRTHQHVKLCKKKERIIITGTEKEVRNRGQGSHKNTNNTQEQEEHEPPEKKGRMERKMKWRKKENKFE